VNPYTVLGVAATATDAEIRRAYVALARRFHPDANPGGEERMRSVNEAWAILGDRERRAAFDRGRTPEADPGFQPDDPHEDAFDPRAQPDVPYRPVAPRQVQRRGMVTMAPIGLFAVAFMTSSSGFFLDAPGLIGLGVVLFSISCIAMIVVLLSVLSSARRDEG
jgi:hypothetical protein